MEELANEELIRRYHKETDIEKKELLKEQLFKRNFYFANSFIRRYRTVKFNDEELAAIARYGMVKAFKYYEVDGGSNFINFAKIVMHSEISREIRDDKSLLGVSSLDEPVSSDTEDITLVETVQSYVDVQTEVEMKLLVDELKQVMPHLLDWLELATIQNILEEAPLPQTKLAKQLGLTQVQVSRAYRKALTKLRNYLEGDGLNEVS